MFRLSLSDDETTQLFKWTQEIINKFIYRKGGNDNYELLRRKLEDIRKAGINQEQRIWEEIKEVRTRADNAHK